MGEFTIGKVGFGFKLMLGPFQPGFYLAEGDEIGLKHGYLGVSSIDETAIFASLIEKSIPKKSYQDREKKATFSPQRYHPTHYWRFGIVVGFSGTFRLVVNPMEILDFFLGFAGVDISKDDIFSKNYTSRGPKDIIYYANKKNYRKELIQILRAPRKNNKDQYWDERALHTYLKWQQPEPYILKLFLKRGISTIAMKPTLSLYLSYHRKSSASVIRFLIKNGADINYAKNTQENPLWLSAAYGHVEKTQILLSLEADKNIIVTTYIRNKCDSLQFKINRKKQELQNCKKRRKDPSKCNYYQERVNNSQNMLKKYRKILKLLQANE
ncbi:MAG: hypothetical protein AAF518_10275 [Spirochaetota bacterium]